MTPPGTHLFLLGFAAGVSLLPLTVYARLSPRWLRWLLLAVGLFVTSRYVVMALFTRAALSPTLWELRRCWWATSVGLTLPSVFAVDRLLCHPAMTPKRLLQWYAPFLAVLGLFLVLAPARPLLDPAFGWLPQMPWVGRTLFFTTEVLFVIGFLAGCAFFILKVPSPPIRSALLVLALSQVLFGIAEGLRLVAERRFVWSSLGIELLVLVALWHAYETAFRLQNQ